MAPRFDVLLLDLNGTFMFGQDRFDVAQQYGRTYRIVGGTSLADDDVNRAVTQVVEYLTTIGRCAKHHDAFPSVLDALRTLPLTAKLPDAELLVLEQVVASHELGRVPDEYASFVRALADSHRLGLVSNLWSQKGPWLAELERVGLAAVFDWLVFSSDGPSVKPSRRIFQPILDEWECPPHRALMIGDSLRRDVAGARAIGVPSLWISAGARVPPGAPTPDYCVADLLDGDWLLV